MSSQNFFSSLRAGVCFAALVLSSCGGGGGGGGDNTNPGSGGNKNISLNVSSVSCNSFQNDFTADSHDVRVSWTNSKVDAFVVGTLPGEPIPAWLTADVIGSGSPITVQIHCTSGGLPPGHYAITLRFVTGDTSQNILGQKDIPVTFDIVADPVVNGAVATWVETETPADRTITVSPGAGISVSSVSSTLPWLNASLSGNTITLKGTSEAATLMPGSYAGTLQTTVKLGTRSKIIISPLEYFVTRALSGPPSLNIVIDADTVAADLTAHAATIITATTAQTGFTVESDLAWVSAAPGTTGAADNLKLTVVVGGAGVTPFGPNAGTLTIIPANGAVPLEIPVVIDVRLPDVHFVAPVAFTDTLTTDYVVVRGGGFTSPGFQLRVDGAPVADTHVVNDTEIRFVPGPLAVGDHVVNSNNALGVERESAMLRVADPPPYRNAVVAANVGPQDRVVSSPINSAVFASRAYFTDSYANPPVGNSSVINRYTYGAGNQWTHTEHAYPQLFDFALSPDESQLIVLTASDLRIVDPGTMQTLDIYPLTNSVDGYARQLGVLNNGLVIIDAAHSVFSLHTRGWVDNFPIYPTSGGIMASRDGSRAVVGYNNSPHSYIDASTNSLMVDLANHPFYCCGVISRHGTVALINEYVLDVGGGVLGSLPTTGFLGDLSPDGHRAYGHDFVSRYLRTFDLTTTPFTELVPIEYPAEVVNDIGRIAVDPAGHLAYKITDKYFVVTELP